MCRSFLLVEEVCDEAVPTTDHFRHRKQNRKKTEDNILQKSNRLPTILHTGTIRAQGRAHPSLKQLESKLVVSS
jgi:hypothetical protein